MTASLCGLASCSRPAGRPGRQTALLLARCHAPAAGRHPGLLGGQVLSHPRQQQLPCQAGLSGQGIALSVLAVHPEAGRIGSGPDALCTTLLAPAGCCSSATRRKRPYHPSLRVVTSALAAVSCTDRDRHLSTCADGLGEPLLKLRDALLQALQLQHVLPRCRREGLALVDKGALLLGRPHIVLCARPASLRSGGTAARAGSPCGQAFKELAECMACIPSDRVRTCSLLKVRAPSRSRTTSAGSQAARREALGAFLDRLADAVGSISALPRAHTACQSGDHAWGHSPLAGLQPRLRSTSQHTKPVARRPCLQEGPRWQLVLVPLHGDARGRDASPQEPACGGGEAGGAATPCTAGCRRRDGRCPQPEAINSFIDRVVAAPFQELPAVLADFQWTFDKVCLAASSVACEPA